MNQEEHNRIYFIQRNFFSFFSILTRVDNLFVLVFHKAFEVNYSRMEAWIYGLVNLEEQLLDDLALVIGSEEYLRVTVSNTIIGY